MKNLFLALILIVAACTQKKEHAEKNDKTEDTLSQATLKTRTVRAADLKTGQDSSTAVISNAQKFIIPVPAFKDGGEPLIYPKNQPKAGQTITDYQGKPIGKNGIVFFNFKDQSVQAAAGDGKGVIIINEVTQEQAEKLDKETTAAVQNIGNKTFYLDENSVWIDAEFKPENKQTNVELALKYLSSIIKKRSIVFLNIFTYWNP